MAVYRQRATVLDDFLLQVVFPILSSTHVGPLLRMARFWSVPMLEPEFATIQAMTVLEDKALRGSAGAKPLGRFAN